MKRCQRWSNLTSLHNFVELRFSHAQRCPRYIVQFTICATNPVFFPPRLPPAKPLPRRLGFCQRVLVFGIVWQLSFSRDTVLHSSLEQNRMFGHPLGQTLCCFRKVYSVLGRGSVSCCILHSSELDSFLRLTPICLVVSFVKCSMSWCSQRASRFNDAEECASQVKFSAQYFSNLVCPNSMHTIQRQKTFHSRFFESTCSHSFAEFGFEKCVHVIVFRLRLTKTHKSQRRALPCSHLTHLTHLSGIFVDTFRMYTASQHEIPR